MPEQQVTSTRDTSKQALIDEWRRNYLVGFRAVADEDCGVDGDADGPRCCYEYWHALTAAERAARLANPADGEWDGRKDADALNEA